VQRIQTERRVVKIKIVSGGQTGVDQGALEAARCLGLEWGGWVPKGWRTEAGPLNAAYRERMQEHSSANYRSRTQKNVIDSHATLILTHELPLSGGTRKTLDFALMARRPHLVVCLDEEKGKEKASAWLRSFYEVDTPPSLLILNVAGPRESKACGIQKRTTGFLLDVLTGIGLGSASAASVALKYLDFMK